MYIKKAPDSFDRSFLDHKLSAPGIRGFRIGKPMAEIRHRR